MAISWGVAYTESNGSPSTLYEYRAEYEDRQVDKVRIKLYIRVRMQYYSNFFSFRITHAAKVNGVFQTGDIKTSRYFWGHQWAGSYDDVGDFDWWYGSYDYDGSNWHGWYKVFDAYVPVGVNDTSVEIIPCITREPITGPGNPYGTAYPHGTNSLDKTNWQGYAGVWRPWRDTAYIGSWADRPLTQDGAFLNNRWLQPLEGGFHIPAYPRPSKIGKIDISPTSIDVRYQETQELVATWSTPSNATGYKVWLKRSDEQKYLGTTTQTSYKINPYRAFGMKEIMDGEEFSFVVMPYDANGVEAASSTESDKAKYYEVPSYAPNMCYVVGRKGTNNEILYKGESVSISYSGMSDGSYPIATYALVRKSDGARIEWSRSLEGAGSPKTVIKDMQGVPRPNVTVDWELQAYNTKGRPCYPKNASQWLTIAVKYYGGLVYVYDKKAGKWRDGLARVYVNGAWHEADAVYTYVNGAWRTL